MFVCVCMLSICDQLYLLSDSVGVYSTSLAGELDHGDLTDDELLEEKKTKRTTLPPPLRPLVKKNSVTMEMLVS